MLRLSLKRLGWLFIFAMTGVGLLLLTLSSTCLAHRLLCQPAAAESWGTFGGSTPTPTATPSGDVILTGQVYDAAIGPAQPISGATVSVLMCVPRRFETSSGADGHYSLLLPGLYLNACSEVTLEAWATGYESVSQPVSVADLRAHPQRDFALTRGPTATPTVTPPRYWIALPVVSKDAP